MVAHLISGVQDTIPIRGCAGSDRLISWQQLNVFSVQGTFIKLYRTALKKGGASLAHWPGKGGET